MAFDSLSRYLRVESLKIKYAAETAQALKNLIKHKPGEKFGVDDGTEVLGAFTTLQLHALIAELIYTVRLVQKDCFCGKNMRSLKTIIYK